MFIFSSPSLSLCNLPNLGFDVVEMEPRQALQFRNRSMSSVFGGKPFPGERLLSPCRTLDSFWETAFPPRGLDRWLGLPNPVLDLGLDLPNSVLDLGLGLPNPVLDLGLGLPNPVLDLGLGFANPSVILCSSGSLVLLPLLFFLPVFERFSRLLGDNCWLLWEVGKFSNLVAGFRPVRPLRPDPFGEK